MRIWKTAERATVAFSLLAFFAVATAPAQAQPPGRDVERAIPQSKADALARGVGPSPRGTFQEQAAETVVDPREDSSVQEDPDPGRSTRPEARTPPLTGRGKTVQAILPGGLIL